MALVDAGGRVLEVNPALERLAGRAAAELVAQPFSQSLHKDDLPRLTEVLSALDAGRTDEAHLECHVARPDDSVRDAMLTVSGIRHASGKPLGYVVTAEDLAERRHAERAEAENQAKSRFLALMSHELRTPLNAVLGFSQLLERQDFGPLNERQVRYVFNIRSAGQHLLTLVNDLLDLSKVAAGRMEFRAEVVDVQSVFDDTLTSIRLAAEAKGLSLEQSVEPGLTAYADDVRLRQVVLNLLTNAVKFTQTGGISVKAAALGDQTCIEVTDSGIGIPTDEQSRLFVEFSQVDSSLARTQQGSGLGLALSKGLITGMGGSIKVDSEEGKGSKFSVLIPRVAPTET
jgi:PAS domain S-box-containing protein